MRGKGFAVALWLALAVPVNGSEMPVATPGDARPRINIYPVGTGAEYAMVVPGEKAPNFSYESDGRSLRLHHLRAQGHVLLVLGAGDAQLRALESQRDALLRLGVVPVAVLDIRHGSCRSAARRLGLNYPVIADPTRVIGAQFNALEPRTRLTAPAWFIVDRGGSVRALDRFEWPQSTWREVAISSLGLASDDAPIPASFGGR